MNKLYLIVFLFCFGASFGYGQTKREMIQAKRVEYITRKLDLSVEEAEKFWPIQNAYDKERKALRKQHKSLKPVDGIDNLSDSQLEELLSTSILIKQKELDLDKKHLLDLKKVLPIKKIAQLRMAEESFKRELLRTLKNKKTDGKHAQKF